MDEQELDDAVDFVVRMVKDAGGFMGYRDFFAGTYKGLGYREDDTYYPLHRAVERELLYITNGWAIAAKKI